MIARSGARSPCRMSAKNLEGQARQAGQELYKGLLAGRSCLLLERGPYGRALLLGCAQGLLMIFAELMTGAKVRQSHRDVFLREIAACRGSDPTGPKSTRRCTSDGRPFFVPTQFAFECRTSQQERPAGAS